MFQRKNGDDSRVTEFRDAELLQRELVDMTIVICLRAGLRPIVSLTIVAGASYFSNCEQLRGFYRSHEDGV
jgi:hypothetical protein